jgi:hypothetical protein
MLLLIILISYLTMGALIARRDFAQRTLNCPDFEAELAAADRKICAIKHSNSCWLGTGYDRDPYGRRHKCDCTKKIEWTKAKAQYNGAEARAATHQVKGPYPMLFLYPAIGFHRFLTNGSVKGYNPALTAKLEKELGMEQDA